MDSGLAGMVMGTSMNLQEILRYAQDVINDVALQ